MLWRDCRGAFSGHTHDANVLAAKGLQLKANLQLCRQAQCDLPDASVSHANRQCNSSSALLSV